MRRTLFPILILVLAACSGTGSEGPLLTFADFNNPPTSVDTTTSTSTPASTSTTTSSSTTTTLLVLDAPGPVSITSADGYSVLAGRGAPRRLIDLPVAAAFDDLQGGLVFQFPGAGVETGADQRIYWSRAARPGAQAYLDVEDGSLLRLWGTEIVAGSPQMILSIVDDADDPAARVERLVLFDFERGDRVIGEIGDAGSGPVAIDYGSGRFLLDQRAGVRSSFEFRNDQGALIDLTSNPNPGCADDPTCPTHPALDASGSFLAYLQRSIDGAEQLVVKDLDLDEEIHRIDLPDDLGAVTGLALDGPTAIVNRAAPLRALIVDTDTGTFGEFGLSGSIRFLREVPAFEGPVQIPQG